MKNWKAILGIFAVVVVGAGCSSSESDLTKEDRVKMDKLFREGVKPPANSSTTPATPDAPAPRGQGGTPINSADL